MQGVPTFLSGGVVVLTKTPNGGFAISENKGDPASKCPVFDAWADCLYYLETHYVPSAAA